MAVLALDPVQAILERLLAIEGWSRIATYHEAASAVPKVSYD